MTDQKIIELIKAKELDKAFDYLYRYYSNVKKYILKNNGKEDDAKDVFQETLMLLYHKILLPDFTLTSSLKTFTIAISKNIWLKNLSKQKEINMHQDADKLTEAIEPEDAEIKYVLLDEVLKNLGEKCLSILKLFYFEEKNMEEIAQLQGLSNEHVARTQKYKCLEKARKMAQELKNDATYIQNIKL